jgi:hypothetical protein
MVSTGPLHAEVGQFVALPLLPSRIGSVTPVAGSIVSGAANVVPGVSTVKFPL